MPPERGDIVIFRYPDNEEELYVKRVIGLPGETVDIRDGYIYIDGADTPLDEDYLKEDWTVATGNYHFEVPEDSYLMLGDNRNDSWDARYWTNPYVREDKILGKAASPVPSIFTASLPVSPASTFRLLKMTVRALAE